MSRETLITIAAAVALLVVGTVAVIWWMNPSEEQSPTGSAAGASQELVLYAGRSRSLVQPIIDDFQQNTGIRVRVRYGSDAQMLAMLREEGAHSPADVLWMNTAGALGAANNADLLAQLPQSLLDKPTAFVPSSGRWVPGTVRFRTLAYAPARVDADRLPDSVMDVAGLEPFSGRIGWTPAYSSFQDFVTAMRLVHGRQATLDWLEQIKTLQPKTYPGNTAMLQALAAGEIDVALTNHYYVIRLQQQHDGDSAIVDMHHFEPGDVGNLALVTGAAVLNTTNRSQTAHQLIDYLLQNTQQHYAATELHEYPVIDDITLPQHMLPMQRALTLSPQLDFERLRELEQTLELLRSAGLF